MVCATAERQGTEVPVQSEKQRRFMYASLAGKTDVSPSVAKKFVGPSAHKESDMKQPMPAFLMKKDDKKPKKMKEAKGKPFAKGGGVESKGKKTKMVKMMGGGKC